MKKLSLKKIDFKIVVRAAVVIVAAISIIFVVASSFSNVRLSNFTGVIESFFLNMKRGEGYPYECSSGGAERTDIVGSYLAMLDDTNVIFLNKTAKEVMRYDTTYTNPEINISNGRALIYNRGSSAFSVSGQSDLLYETSETDGVIEDAIVVACIGKKGNLAFGTWTDDGTSKLTVLNKNLRKVFYYVFGSERILSVALSDNGKYAACAVFGAENASYYTKVLVFDLDKSDPIQSVKFEDETVISLEFLKNKTLNIVTDRKRREISVDDKSEENVVDFSSHSLVGADFDDSSKRSVLCYSKYGSTSNVVYGFYKNGKESCIIEDIENVKAVSCSSKMIAVLTDHNIYCYSYRGRLKTTIDLTFNVDTIELDSSCVYAFSGSNVYRVKTSRDSTLKAE